MTISNRCRVSNSSQKLGRYGVAFVSTATVHRMIFAGTSQRSGTSYRRRPILFRLFRRGRNSCEGLSSIGNLLMSKRPKLRVARSHINGDLSRNADA